MTSLPDRRFPVFDHDQAYYHARQRWSRAIALRGFLFHSLLRVETHGLANIPREGGGLLMMNHRAALDPVVMQGVVFPRTLCVMSKIENFRIPAVQQMMRLWGCYPIERATLDRRALDYTLRILRAGELVLIAPEGHRADALQPARDGLPFLATRADGFVIPVGLRGTRGVAASWQRLRPARIDVTFGRPFRFRSAGKMPARRRDLAIMTTEAMYQLAALLDAPQRGIYSDLSKSTTDTLEFLP